ncbi:MAG: hypothetical protein AB7G10_04265 [Reyranellaceae bacterium]
MKPPPPIPAKRESLAERVERWAGIVTSLERGWRFDLDDWLNDMDLRQLIHEGWPLYGPEEKAAVEEALQHADSHFLLHTVDAGKCLWGRKAARREKWSAKANWWYFRKPRKAQTAFIEEVERVR